MPLVARSKARQGQPLDLVVSPKEREENRPRRIVESRQGNAVVPGHEEVEVRAQHMLLPMGVIFSWCQYYHYLYYYYIVLNANLCFVLFLCWFEC